MVRWLWAVGLAAVVGVGVWGVMEVEWRSAASSLPMSMVRIPGGTYTIGSPSSESDRGDDEDQVRVTLSSFWMMTHEVTQDQYEAVMGTNPSDFSGCSKCPVENVSWYDAVAYANALSEREGLTPAYSISGETVQWNRSASGYRLLTEAEWEVAARRGQAYRYAGSDEAGAVGWYDDNSGGKTHPVCGKRKNGYGLCDMSGNVWEWTWNWYARAHSGGTNPIGPASGSARVYRGGSLSNHAGRIRVANRYSDSPTYRSGNLGFRLSRTIPPILPPEMKKIPGGTYTIGSPSSEWGRLSDEDQVRVTLSSFWMMTHEVTQEQYEVVMGTNPSSFSGCSNCPVEMVSWDDAVAYANALSEREGLTPAYSISGESVQWNRSANGYRLPTEAEWEVAARGGQSYRYAGSDDATAVGWYGDNSGGETHRVCGKRKNGYGLCDMSGNVREWTWNWFARAHSSGTNPIGPAWGNYRVSRDGGWSDYAMYIRVANRYYHDWWIVRGNYLGFRLSRTIP